MDKFLMEMHCHTSESSNCGNISAADGVEMYISKGYGGMVITDHFQFSDFNSMSKREYNKKADMLKMGYEAALEAANGRIVILRGAEVRLPESCNDYLVYGVDESFIRDNPDMRNMKIEQFSALCRANGLLLIQAHPFRNYMDIVKPELLDGIEIFNGNARHDSRNDIAALWAEKFNFITTSGSDFHETEDLANGGTYFDEPISDSEKLISLLKSKKYSTMPL